MADTRTVKLPVGLIHEGKRYRNVVLRPLSGRALLSARGKVGKQADPTVALDVLQETVVGFEEGFEGKVPVGRLTWADGDFIFRELVIWEHECTGEPFIVRRTCNSCGRTGEVEIDPHSQSCRMIEDTEFGESDDMTIPFKLVTPITTLDPDGTPYQDGRIGLPTMEDEIRRLKRDPQVGGRFWAEGILNMLVELGPKRKGELALADLEAMPAWELKRLERLYAENDPGLEPLLVGTCRGCRNETELDQPVVWLSDFLLFSPVLGSTG